MLVRAVKLRDLRFHDLRHDAASVLTTAGASQREVMKILGHRDPRMTVRYQHLAPDHLRDVMGALDTALRAATDAPGPFSTGTISAPGKRRADR